MRLWEKSPDFPGEKEAFSWLYRITTNIGIDYLRRHSTKFEREISSDFESGLTEYMGHECRSELEFIFKELTEEESQILIFHTVDQMEKNEISKILSIPLRSLHRKFSRLDEKIQKLRERTYDT